MNGLDRTFPGRRHVLLPVIHVESESQALRNAVLAREGGCDGVFLINHDISAAELLTIHKAVVKQLPDWWVGVRRAAVARPSTARWYLKATPPN